VAHSVRRPKMKFLFFQSYRFLFYPPSAENLKTQKPCYGIPNFDNFFRHPKRGPNCAYSGTNHFEIGRKIKKLSHFWNKCFNFSLWKFGKISYDLVTWAVFFEMSHRFWTLFFLRCIKSRKISPSGRWNPFWIRLKNKKVIAFLKKKFLSHIMVFYKFFCWFFQFLFRIRMHNYSISSLMLSQNLNNYRNETSVSPHNVRRANFKFTWYLAWSFLIVPDGGISNRWASPST
jgi:hypothetical protein